MANALNGSDRNILDSTNCVKLSSILESFNAPINEEQCWALCHQTIKTISTLIDKRPLYLLNGPSNLYINKDGFVHQKSFLESNDHKRLTPSLNKLIASIGATLFLALDYGLESQEERSLDPKLELLIDRLTCSTDDKEDENEDKESNDEGIERDSPEYEFGPLLIDGSNLVEQVLNVCNGRLGGAEEAETHYRAVCRALVAEAMELSSFLYKITSVTAELKNGAISMSNSGGHHHHHSTNSNDCADSSGALISLEGLRLADWARLWMQVIQELRQGVKLKKVSLTEKPSFEFELTPYEMLLDDIRSRRYKLNKVKVNGSSPSRVTKDAHDLILDFIRSRPPLVPVSNRKLPPPPVREPSLFEKLLDSIRQQPKLKVIPPESLNQRSSPIRLGRVREDNCDSMCNKNNNYEYNNNNNVNNNNIILNNNNNNNHCNKTSSTSSASISLSISCSSTFTKNTSTTVKTASTKSSTSSSSSSAPITATTTTGLPSKLSQQQQARSSSKQPKYILQEDPESLQGPKKKLVKSNLTLKILLSIDDDDDDIIQIQYK